MPLVHGGVKRFRKELGMTQHGLAAMLDVPQSTVYHWEKGTKMPNMKHFGKLLDLAHKYGIEQPIRFFWVAR